MGIGSSRPRVGWRIAILGIVWCLALGAGAHAAGERETVIALDLDAPNADSNQAAGLIVRFRDELVRTGRFTLVDRSQMDRTLAEQGYRQGVGCINAKCYTAISRILGVTRLVQARVARQGTAFALSAQLMEVGDSVTIWPVTLQYPGSSYTDVLNGGLAKLADQVAAAGPAKSGEAQAAAGGAKPWLEKGFALRKPNGDFDPPELAAYQFSKAISAERNNPAAYAARAQVYLQLQQYVDALKDYDAAIRLDPRRASHYYGRSLAHQALRQAPQACADVRKACELGDQGVCALVKKQGC
jgi:tetratricopeptide (TPR) repeat protein